MKRCTFIILLVFTFSANAQIITLFAGNGVDVYGGDGGPATAAGIPDPGGGIFDKYGNYYFVGLENEKRIRKIDTNGIITTVAGGGTGGDGVPATAARLNLPSNVKLDTSGNLIISDGGNNKIRKVDIITGIISTLAGTGTGAHTGDGGPATAAELYDPQDVAIDKRGNIYIADAYNYVVRKINTLGIISTYAGTGISGPIGDGGPATAAYLEIPSGLVIDDTGNLYIADYDANRIRKVDTEGIISTFAGNGTGIYSGDGIPAVDAQINPNAIALDSLNNLYISDEYNLRVFKVDNAGIIHCVAGNGVAGFSGDGGTATAAEFNHPDGVAVDACGNLYIPESGTLSIPDSGNNIRKVTFNTTCDPYRGRPLNLKEVASNKNISIYPNPVYGELTVSSGNGIEGVVISNVVGQTTPCPLLKTGGGVFRADVSGLPPGVYVVRVTDGEGDVVVRKVVKE